MASAPAQPRAQNVLNGVDDRLQLNASRTTTHRVLLELGGITVLTAHSLRLLGSDWDMALLTPSK